MQVKREAIRTIRCPFDPNHVMPYERFLNHIEKCQFPAKKSYRKCKFNPYHIHHMDLISSHENSCPDRKKFEVVDDDDWGATEEIVQPQQVNENTTKIDRSVVSTSFNTDRGSEFSNADLSSLKSTQKASKKEKPSKKNELIEVYDLDHYTSNPNKK